MWTVLLVSCRKQTDASKDNSEKLDTQVTGLHNLITLVAMSEVELWLPWEHKPCVTYYKQWTGVPTASYRWTSWVWELTSWSSRLRKITCYSRGINIPQLKSRMITMAGNQAQGTCICLVTLRWHGPGKSKLLRFLTPPQLQNWLHCPNPSKGTIWFTRLLDSLSTQSPLPITVYGDNQAVIQLIKNVDYHR